MMQTGKNTKTIVFFNNKGGVGKTTIAINISAGLAKMGKKILLVDRDSQQNSCRFLTEINATEKNKSEILNTRYENVFVSTEIPMDNGDYDYIILDLPPTINDDTIADLSLCNAVFVPIDLSAFSIQGIKRVTDTLNSIKVDNKGIKYYTFVNKFYNKKADIMLLENFKSALGTKVLDTVIPNSHAIRNSITFGQTAFEYTGSKKAQAVLMNLITEIEGKLK